MEGILDTNEPTEKPSQSDRTRFKIEDVLKDLRGKGRLRLYRIYFTSEKMYLVEYFNVWGFYGVRPGLILSRLILSPLLIRMARKKLDSFDDIGYVLHEHSWHRKFKYAEVRSVKIIRGLRTCRLRFHVNPDKKNPDIGIDEGEGYVFFKTKYLELYEKILKKRFGDKLSYEN